MRNVLRNVLFTAFGLLALLGAATALQLPLPAVNGPYLGDSLNNLYQLTLAYERAEGLQNSPGLSVSQTSGQANCTQLNLAALQEVKTSAGTGYVCLPTALSGKVVMIGNASTQTIDLYGSATTAVSGTQDTINGTTGTTAYTGLTSGKSALCFAASTGAWYCGSIS